MKYIMNKTFKLILKLVLKKIARLPRNNQRYIMITFAWVYIYRPICIYGLSM